MAVFPLSHLKRLDSRVVRARRHLAICQFLFKEVNNELNVLRHAASSVLYTIDLRSRRSCAWSCCCECRMESELIWTRWSLACTNSSTHLADFTDTEA